MKTQATSKSRRKRPGRGRPAMPPAERRSVTLRIRLTASELAEFSAAASAADAPLHIWARETLRAAAAKIDWMQPGGGAGRG